MIFDRFHNLYGDTMQFLCELRLTLEDGSEQVISTDDSWQSLPSPVTFSNIYDGEHYDARREIPDWCLPGCAAPSPGWSPAPRACRSSPPAGAPRL